MASQDEHHTTSELGEQLQNHQDEDVSTDERDRIAVVQWFVLLAATPVVVLLSRWPSLTRSKRTTRRLRDNYTINSAGSVSKCEVYAHYLDMCNQKGTSYLQLLPQTSQGPPHHLLPLAGVTFPMSRTFYGKLVRRAFPGIKSNRKGPRGQAKYAPQTPPPLLLSFPLFSSAGLFPFAKQQPFPI
jgi:hypothetical protein